MPRTDYQGLRLNPQQRRFVLRMIAEYKSTPVIVEMIKERWGIERSPGTIEQQYRYNPVYKEQIAKYRKQYNDRAGDHPLNNPQVILDYLKIGLDFAVKNEDAKAIERLVDQACKIKGFHAPKEIEVSHTAGEMSWEDTWKTLQEQAQSSAVDVQAEPLPMQTLALPEKLETTEPLPLPDSSP